MNGRDKLALEMLKIICSNSGPRDGMTKEEAEEITLARTYGAFCMADAFLKVKDEGCFFEVDEWEF